MNEQITRSIWTTREVAEAAAEAGRPVTQEYIRQLCKRGVIPAMKPSRDWLIADSHARAWLADWLGSDLN